MRFIVFATLLVFLVTWNQPCSIFAVIRVADVFCDNLVLQLDQSLPIWGWTEPNQYVIVNMCGITKLTQADETVRNYKIKV